MDDASIALEFLLSNNYSDTIEKLLYLDELNNDRKHIQKKVLHEAQEFVKR